MERDLYRQQSRTLRAELMEAQREARSAGVGTLLLPSGVDAAGKGDSVNQLMAWLDPRFVRTRAFDRTSSEETDRPHFWRYWRALPARGELGVFLSAWYSTPLLRRAHGASRAWLDRELNRIRSLERTLTADGYALAKIWLHLDRDAQREQFVRLQSDPEQSWRVTLTDWDHWHMYEEFSAAAEEIIKQTDTPECPWHVIDGSDEASRRLAVGQALLATLRKRPDGSSTSGIPCATSFPCVSDLDDAGERSRIPRSEYREQLTHLRKTLNTLHRRARAVGVSLVAVFEGRDASGKGGAIRRVVPAFDARSVDVIRTGPPNDEERAHHYLWRFWRRIPPAGQVALFDRSWYGRVLVERVERIASTEEWTRAYDEIRDFEHQLVEGGAAVVKFWLHIDDDEQALRFDERRSAALKRWKITDDDLRNRRLWPQYESAVEDAIARTDSAEAPWRVVPANDKRQARLTVLQELCDALERRLDAFGSIPADPGSGDNVAQLSNQ